MFYSIDREKLYQKLLGVFFFISSPKGRKTASKVMKTGFSPTLSKVWSREELEKIPDYSPWNSLSILRISARYDLAPKKTIIPEKVDEKIS